MTETVIVAVHIMVDASGEYVVAVDEDACIEAFSQEIGVPCAASHYRLEIETPVPGVQKLTTRVESDGPLKLRIVK